MFVLEGNLILCLPWQWEGAGFVKFALPLPEQAAKPQAPWL